MGDPCTEYGVLKMLELVSPERRKAKEPIWVACLLAFSCHENSTKFGKIQEKYEEETDIFIPHKAQYSTAMLLTLKAVF